MHRPAPALTLALLTAILLGGCATLSPHPEIPVQPATRDVTLRFAAAPRLNADRRGQGLALVVRVYTLRQRTAFDAAPYAAFLTPDAERAALGNDLVTVREVTLVPGQRIALAEQPGRDAYVGVVALFHAPAPGAWRLSFAVIEAPPEGIGLSLGACTLRRAGDPASLARCQ